MPQIRISHRLGILAISILPLAFVAKAYGETNSHICHFQTTSGNLLNLNKICTGNSARKEILITTNLNSPFVTEEGGIYWVKPGAPTAFQLPTGHIIYPDGTIKEPDTTTYRPIIRNGSVVGTQYFRADGSAMKVGETFKLPNGATIRQESY